MAAEGGSTGFLESPRACPVSRSRPLNQTLPEYLLARAPDKHAEAESCFREGLDFARRQGAKSLELCPVTSLSRLYLEQGRPEEARQMLAEIYSVFTEGFDTADSREA